jgi:EAL domain-containing protein (putative c-di-GMP-specific phosphodiesterase class I)/CheY-like chemotaxis protein
MTFSPKILVIDDDPDFGDMIVAAATAMKMLCTATTNARDFFAALNSEPSIIVLDLLMPEMDGIELLRKMAEEGCRARIILMSGVGLQIIEAAERLAESLGLVIGGHLQKPFALSELERLLRAQSESLDLSLLPKPRESLAIADDDLYRAIERNEFVLHYQPQVHIKTHTVSGFEALVRWAHPKLGLVFPDHFIPRLENLGLIDRLDWLVMTRGFSEIRHFSGDLLDRVTLSVNIPASSLRKLDFPDRAIALAQTFRIPSQSIVIEITESRLVEELSRTLDVLTRLRVKGIQLSIDDFGTGYSMLQQLHLVPATELKIDKSFVRSVHQKRVKQVMVRKTIEIGHEIGMKVIAEGVESQEELAYLQANGCDAVQGFLFCPPLPSLDLAKWLMEFKSRPKN